MEHTVLFRTVHGSRLYGLAHDGSDHDYYTVVDKVKTARAKYSSQSIIDGTDSVVVDFGTWVDQCVSGVPQALEAMFSDMALEDSIGDFRAGFRAGSGVWDRYLRTIKSFAMSDKDPYKRKRHSLRLALNFKDIRETGRFNPTLTPVEAGYISDIAMRDSETVYDKAMQIAWS